MTISDIDLVEINEAFAAQVISSCRELGIGLDAATECSVPHDDHAVA